MKDDNVPSISIHNRQKLTADMSVDFDPGGMPGHLVPLTESVGHATTDHEEAGPSAGAAGYIPGGGQGFKGGALAIPGLPAVAQSELVTHQLMGEVACNGGMVVRHA